MSLLSAISLLALVLVDDNLIAAALLLDFSLDNGPLNVRRTNLDVFIFCDEQDLIELHSLSHIASLEKLVLKNHAFLHAILFSTGLYNCIHVLNTPIRNEFYRSADVISMPLGY